MSATSSYSVHDQAKWRASLDEVDRIVGGAELRQNKDAQEAVLELLKLMIRDFEEFTIDHIKQVGRDDRAHHSSMDALSSLQRLRTLSLQQERTLALLVRKDRALRESESYKKTRLEELRELSEANMAGGATSGSSTMTLQERIQRERNALKEEIRSLEASNNYLESATEEAKRLHGNSPEEAYTFFQSRVNHLERSTA